MTISNPGYERGDVVLVGYPFEERAGGRRRPALVISPSGYNEITGELVIAQITGRVSAQARPGDYHIQDWKQANLPRPSLVRCRLASLPANLVLRRLGVLSEDDLSSAMIALSVVFGPPGPSP